MDLQDAVNSTVKYSAYFNFPLTSEEIHFWLITPHPVTHNSLQKYLPLSLAPKDVKLRSEVSAATAQKIVLADKLVSILRLVPGLRLIGLTGSVAAGNSKENDDIDLIFITAPHVLWLVRPFVLLLISLFFRRRHPGEDHAQATDAFCPNLWLDTSSFCVPVNKQSLYTAHEVLQVKPLLDRRNTYSQFVYHNRWVRKHLANAYIQLLNPHHALHYSTRPRVTLSLVLAPVNYLFYLLQLIYMHPKKTTETVSLHSAYLHTTDFATRISEHLNNSKDI